MEAHVTAAANEILHDNSNCTLHEVSKRVVDNYVLILPSESFIASDTTYLYACEVLTLGLLWYHYLDATREGDGDAIMMLWKFLLLAFKAAGRTNYSNEAAILLLQYNFLFSKRKAAQLKYSRFVNTKGREGCNMPCDLYMEHLNRRLKGVIRHMGSNIQPPSLVRAAKSIGVVHEICSLLEKEVRGKAESDRYLAPSFTKDFTLLLDELTNCEVFKKKAKRRHPSFRFKHGLLEQFDKEKLLDWLTENVVARVLYR